MSSSSRFQGSKVCFHGADVLLRRHINNQPNERKSFKAKIYTEKNYTELYYRKQWKMYLDDTVIKAFSDEGTLMLKFQGREKSIAAKSSRKNISGSRSSRHESLEKERI